MGSVSYVYWLDQALDLFLLSEQRRGHGPLVPLSFASAMHVSLIRQCFHHRANLKLFIILNAATK